MYLLVRHWNKKDKKVKVRFWDAKFLGHATTRNIYENFMEATAKLDSSKFKFQLMVQGM